MPQEDLHPSWSPSCDLRPDRYKFDWVRLPVVAGDSYARDVRWSENRQSLT
jgi:hypothetical protein